MENTLAPPVEIGQFPTREFMVWWERHGQRVFVFFVTIALIMVMTFLPLESGRDLDHPEGQSYVQTAVGGPSQVVHISVRAATN